MSALAFLTLFWGFGPLFGCFRQKCQKRLKTVNSAFYDNSLKTSKLDQTARFHVGVLKARIQGKTYTYSLREQHISIISIFIFLYFLLLNSVPHRWPQPSRQGTAHRNIAWYKTSGGYRLNDNGPKCLKTTSSGLYLS